MQPVWLNESLNCATVPKFKIKRHLWLLISSFGTTFV